MMKNCKIQIFLLISGKKTDAVCTGMPVKFSLQSGICFEILLELDYTYNFFKSSEARKVGTLRPSPSGSMH